MRKARRFVGEPPQRRLVSINPIVLAEFAWTLARVFRLSRGEVARLIDAVLSADDLDVPFRISALRALDSYRNGKADFPDYLLAEINAELGCMSTATFDAAALDSRAFSTVD